MTKITQNINHIRQRLAQLAKNNGKSVDSITLLAVSKTQPADAIREAYQAGLREFGENYVQEALEKMNELEELEITWHFIGPLQSNKTRPVAAHFDWVHTVDRLKIAQRLNDQRPAEMPPLNVCIQVNIDNEPTKSGVTIDALAELAIAVSRLPNLRLRGLMALPKAQDINASASNPFFRLSGQLDTLRHLSPALKAMDTLSMGMTQDMEDAIAAGSTIVRVGTGIFGKRR